MPPTKVMLVDDHALLTESLRDRLQREPTLDVVGVAREAGDAVALAHGLRPDVVLMDIDMPGLSCFDAARRMRAQQPELRIIFLTAHTGDHYIAQALEVGAYGYLTKGETPERIVAAVQRVARGIADYSEEVRARLVIEAGRATLGSGTTTRLAALSERELEVLRYLARGLAKKEVAQLMDIGCRTVEKHTENLMNKLAIHDRVELARYAIREGLVTA